MDERILFDRFHEALDMEPRPGAYERMRFAMTNRPVALKGRPAYRMRWSKMGLRIAAGLTAAVIVIAVAAAVIVAHRGPVGLAPAGQDPNVKAYQGMIRSDYDAINTATSNSSCNSIQDSTCQAVINVAIPALQKWVSDLSSFRTPSQFVIVDAQLRAHLNEAVSELKAAAAFQNAGNASGFNRAMDAAYYERAWIDPTMYAIVGSYPRVAGTYHDAFRLTRQSLDGCINFTPAPADIGCSGLLNNICSGGPDLTCQSATRSTATQIQTFLIALLQNPAPSSLTTKNAQLMADLAKADTAILAITDAVLSGNGAKVSAGQSSFSASIHAADTDALALGNP